MCVDRTRLAAHDCCRNGSCFVVSGVVGVARVRCVIDI